MTKLRAVSPAHRDHIAAAYENSRPEVRRHVPPGVRRVLDLGCSSGALGAALKREHSCEVVGVETDPEYAQAARTRLDAVHEIDLEQLATDDSRISALGDFDCLIAADVLEHLREPHQVLERLGTRVRSGGVAIVSLPNVRFWETFWQLGRHGDWPRRSEGIFDRTHLRWFTVGRGVELVTEGGFRVAEIDRIYRMRPQISRWDTTARRLGRTPLRPFLTFQFIVVGRRP